MSRIVLFGSGQSGSTLLGMGLALSREVTVLGEISELGRVDPTVHECTCGALFGACPVWGDLFQNGVHREPFGPGRVRRALARATEVEGTLHCVDSCKGNASLEVEGELGFDDARLLYLVRHPCGYIYSQLNSGYELEYARDAWIDEQERLLQRLDAWGEPFRIVRYEDFAREPGAELGRIGEWLGIAGPFGERQGAWDFERAPWGARQHVLSGASWRLGEKLRPTVEEDVRWRHALAPRYARLIVEACRPLLVRFGYEA